MKVSARNRFNGRVASIVPGAVNALVEVALAGGDRLVAVVTLDSIASLGLAEGGEVVALVKAPWVMLMAADEPLKLSARNQLRGVVRAVQSGPVNAEVSLQLPGGSLITALVTREAVAELGLTPGAEAVAVVKSSQVILGVPA